MTRVWTEAEIRALGVRTDLVTACSIVYGCGRTKAYEMHAAGELPFRVLRAGNRLVVPVQPLLRLLELTRDMSVAPSAGGANATDSTTQEEVDGPHRRLTRAD